MTTEVVEPKDVTQPPATRHTLSAYRGYRPPPGMLAWAFHRISGLGVLLFLLLHIVDIFTVGYGPDAFNSLLVIYRHPVFRVAELLLIAGLYYHAANGVRIILIDFWDRAYHYQRELFYAVLAVTVIAFVPSAILMLRSFF